MFGKKSTDYIPWKDGVAYVTSNPGLGSQLDRVWTDNTYLPIRLILQYIGTELWRDIPSLKNADQKSVAIVTSLFRDYRLGSHTVPETVVQLKKEGFEISIPEFQKKLGRANDLSENEYCYRRVIAEEGIDSNNFRRHSSHVFWNAVDLRSATNGTFDENDASQIISAVISWATRKKFSWAPNVHGLNHSITGGGVHIHIGVDVATQAQIDAIDQECGYGKFKKSFPNTISSFEVPQVPQSDPTLNEKDYTDSETHVEGGDIQPDEIENSNLEGEVLPSEIDQKTGLMEVLVIGDTRFLVCPVNQISFSQVSQVMRFDTIRTTGDPKIITGSTPSNFTVNITFPNAQQVDEDLRSLVAQFIMTPVTTIQSRFIARAMKSFYTDHLDAGKTTDWEHSTPADERIWVALNSINIRSIPGFPNAYEVSLTADYFEDRLYGDRLKYLVDENDLPGKYSGKVSTYYDSPVLIPDRLLTSKLDTAGNKARVKVTTNPASSKLYTNYYRSIISDKNDDKPNHLQPFVQDSNNFLQVKFIDLDLNRGVLRNIERTNFEAFSKQLSAVTSILGSSNRIDTYLQQAVGLGAVTKDEVNKFTTTQVVASTAYLASAFSHSQFGRQLADLKNLQVTFRSNLVGMMSKAITNSGAKIKSLGLSANSESIATEFSKKVITYTELLQSFESLPATVLSKNGSSWFNVEGQLTKNDDGTINSNAEGYMRDLEFILKSRLFGFTDTNIPDSIEVTDTKKKEIADVRKAIVVYMDSFLGEFGSQNPSAMIGPADYLKGKDAFFTVANGIDCIITGLAVSMNNKVVPLPIIGWEKPTFQHLGRSDWSINLSITAQGDDYIAALMMVINKTSHISKQVQLNQPIKFMDLNTALEIVEGGGGILRTLGIKKMLLSSVNISTLEGQPGWYSISLTLEQADLDVRGKYERIRTVGTKVMDELYRNIIPVFKSVNTDPRHPGYRKFLDYNRIGSVINDPKMEQVWKDLGMDSVDYMDRYNMLKIFFYNTINIQGANFPNLTTVELQTLWEKIGPAGQNVQGLFAAEKNGDLYALGVGLLTENFGFTSSVNEYIGSLLKLGNSWLEQIEKTKTKVDTKSTFDRTKFGALPGDVKNPLTVTLEKVKFFMFQIGLGLVVQNKLMDVVRDMLLDKSLISILPKGISIQLGTSSFTVEDSLKFASTQIANLMGNCYPDFDVSAVTGKLPAWVLDPAFYLYGTDVISSDLIREATKDLESKADLLKCRIITDIQRADNSILEIERNNVKNSTPSEYTSKVIDKGDIDWIKKVSASIADLTEQAIGNPSQANAELLKGAYKTGEDEIFKGITKEQAFIRVLLVNEAIRWDMLTSSLNVTANKLLDATAGISPTDHEKYTEFIELWYQKIIDNGGIDVNVNGKSVADEAQKKYGTTIEKQFKNLKDLVQQTDRIAKLKKAFQMSGQDSNMDTDVNAKFVAQYMGFLSDSNIYNKQSQELENLQRNMHKLRYNDQHGNPVRIFPTFKLYFIEEESPEWGIFDEFYDYSAIQEITIVQDKRMASETCVIKLSNISNKLTDTFASALPERGYSDLPMNTVMLRPGTTILVKLGYSNNQVELPVKFFGKIIEVNAGPVVEIIAQSFGAELGTLIAPEGIEKDGGDNLRGLGNVATWILQQIKGLDHLGKLGYDSINQNDSVRRDVFPDDFNGVRRTEKVISWFTGVRDFSINDPRDDNVYLPYNWSTLDLGDISNGLLGYPKERSSNFIDRIVRGIVGTNVKFKWFIRSISAWDALEEVSNFHPDTIKVILPYNDNVFPFLKKIRSTLYIGTRNGYYKYTDMFAIDASTEGLKNISKQADAFLQKINELNLLPIPKDSVIGHVLEGLSTSIFGFVGVFFTPVFSGKDSDLDTPWGVNRDQFMTFLLQDQSMLKIVSTVLGIEVEQLIGEANKFFSTIRTGTGKSVLYYKRVVVTAILKAFRDKYTYIDPKTLTLSFNESKWKEDCLVTTKDDISVSGLSFNLTGRSNQYKKVQQHHFISSHLDIINNSISATADGWANQVDIYTFGSDKKFGSIEEIPYDDSKEPTIDHICLDDNIIDDSVRVKNYYSANITSDLWDDMKLSKFVIQNKNSWFAAAGNVTQKEKNGKVITDKGYSARDTLGSRQQGIPWSLVPSKLRVGVSILAKEVANMYDGEITIVGNPTIKVYDIIHMIDSVNDMNGSFEVGRVIHSFNPSTGYVTRIKPDLIVRQKDKFSGEELYYMDRMLNMANFTFFKDLGVLGTELGAGVIGAMVPGIGWLLGGMAIAGFLTGGYQMLKWNAQRYTMTLGNIIGRDSLELYPLTYKGLQYVAGIDGYKKDGPIRHMYSTIFDETGKTTMVERLGYGNAPWEMEYYTKIKRESALFSALKTYAFPQFGHTTDTYQNNNALFPAIGAAAGLGPIGVGAGIAAGAAANHFISK